jgi:uncharacterized protein (DUF4415 family)
MKRADAIWNKGPELIDDDGEVRELTAADFQQMKPFSSLPPELQRTLLEINRAAAANKPEEEQVPVKVSRWVADRFRAEGADWEMKVDRALREWLDEHQAS